MDIYTIVGLTGVAAYVAAYSALQLGVLDGNGVVYSVTNIVAASLVLVSLVEDFNLASAVTQVIWITVGVVGLAMRLMRDRSGPAVVAVEPAVVSVATTRRMRLPVRGNQPTLGLQPDQAPVAKVG